MELLLPSKTWATAAFHIFNKQMPASSNLDCDQKWLLQNKVPTGIGPLRGKADADAEKLELPLDIRIIGTAESR
jgi:hypothetical protein